MGQTELCSITAVSQVVAPMDVVYEDTDGATVCASVYSVRNTEELDGADEMLLVDNFRELNGTALDVTPGGPGWVQVLHYIQSRNLRTYRRNCWFYDGGMV